MIKKREVRASKTKPAVRVNLAEASAKPAKKNVPWVIPAAILAVIALAAAGLYFTKGKKGNEAPVQNASSEKLFGFNMGRPVFADFAEINELVTPKVPGEKATLGELENLKSFRAAGIALSQEQLEALGENNFFLAKNGYIEEEPMQDDFTDTYSEIQGSSNKFFREPQNAVFVSFDTALHLYHILIDRSFQRIEEKKFQPMLRAMTKNLFSDSLHNYVNATEPKIKESYKRLSAFYLAPLVVLDSGNQSAQINLNPKDFETFAKYLEAVSKEEITNSAGQFRFGLDSNIYDGMEVPQEIYELAKAELELINEAKGMSDSPLFTPYRPEFKNDYSQFKPRSHYTKNDILKSYFIAMMWYGRMGFPIKNPEMTRDAIIMTGQVNNLKVGDEKLSKLWGDMAAAIEFFVGEVDDLTPYQYTEEIKKVYGNEMTAGQLNDDALLNNFINKAKKDLPKPKILSEALMIATDGPTKDELLADTMQFRFMGQRFTPDAYVINRLTQGDEAADPETGQKLPSTPTALMVMNILAPDNSLIKNYLDSWIKDKKRIEKENGRESDKVIAKIMTVLQKEFNGYDNDTWNKNIYWGWLNCLRPLLASYGSGYPAFMIGEAWQKKNLGTALGSFTELKHDTLLYAKQSYAELGGGGPDDKLPPVVKGYVEPDLVFWNRITALAKTTNDGLKKLGIMPEEYAGRYDTFIEKAEFLREIVKKELRNEKISDDDFEKLRVVNESFKTITAPLPGQELTLREKRAGIIADIHTNAVLGEILYEATAKPLLIYTAVKDANGARITRGAVYDHRELTGTLDVRLSDEDWQEKVYMGKEKLPPADQWTDDISR